MKNFMEKWNSDSRFKTKVKLSLYTLFVVIVSIFALSGRGNVSTNTTDNFNDNTNNNDINEQEKITIEIPDNYNYTTNITINNNSYQYTGSKDSIKENITKTSNGITTNYIYENDNYYKNDSGTYVLTTKEEVYDIVGYNYLKLETINQYLSKSTNKDDKYIVYLKDIILGNDSEEYISISIKEDKINIDYTSLMKLFDETVENHEVEVVIEEIE